MRTYLFAAVAALVMRLFPAGAVHAQETELPSYLKDRGTGISTSMFGTYVQKGQWLVFPFFAYSVDHNREYQPAELGHGPNEDFRAKYRDAGGQLFIAYGVTDWLALEFETAILSATQKQPKADTSTPAKIRESGLADIEGEIRVCVMKENEHRPEIFGFAEVTVPSQTRKVLIGDPDWDFRPGIGLARGFSWGTMTIRTDVEWNRDDHHWDLGETSLEYLRSLSPQWLLHLGIEGGETGAPDEWELDTGVCWRFSDHASLKFDNALGLSSKATDWAPQLGVMFSFPH